MNIFSFGQVPYTCAHSQEECACPKLNCQTLKLDKPNNMDEGTFFELLQDDGTALLIEGYADLGLSLLRQAYELGRDNPALGMEFCFDVVFELEFQGRFELALSLYKEMIERASDARDVASLSRLFHLLEDFGMKGTAENESAWIQRQCIATRFPEVRKSPRAVRVL